MRRTFNAIDIRGIDRRSQHFDANIVLFHFYWWQLYHSALQPNPEFSKIHTNINLGLGLGIGNKDLVTESGGPWRSQTTALDGGDMTVAENARTDRDWVRAKCGSLSLRWDHDENAISLSLALMMRRFETNCRCATTLDILTS